MIHLDDGVLRAWIDRELGSGAAHVAAHIEGCDDCRARVRELERAAQVVQNALGLLDGPVPRELAWSRVAAGARAPAPPPVSASRSWWRDAPLARAAGIALLCAGGVAAATHPGSPLRSLWTTPAEPMAVDAAGPEASALEVAAPEAGIRAPAGGAVRIELTAPIGTAVQVVLGGVRTGVFGAPTAEFAAGEGWLRATVSDGPIRIEIPRATNVEIETNGVVVAVFVDGTFVRTPEGSARTDGGDQLSFAVR